MGRREVLWRSASLARNAIAILLKGRQRLNMLFVREHTLPSLVINEIL